MPLAHVIKPFENVKKGNLPTACPRGNMNNSESILKSDPRGGATMGSKKGRGLPIVTESKIAHNGGWGPRAWGRGVGGGGGASRRLERVG